MFTKNQAEITEISAKYNMLEKCTGQVYESIMGNCVVFWLMLTRPTTAPGGDYVNKNCHIGAYAQALRGNVLQCPTAGDAVYLFTVYSFYLPDCLHDNGTGPDLSCSSFYF